jgi:hypothetical protein
MIKIEITAKARQTPSGKWVSVVSVGVDEWVFPARFTTELAAHKAAHEILVSGTQTFRNTMDVLQKAAFAFDENLRRAS